jgi:Double-GTPase 1
MTEKTEVLVLGGYSAGKTHFGAQLLARLHKRRGQLLMRGAAPNLSLFDTALACLSEGKTSEHTSSRLYGTLTIPTVSAQGHPIDLSWPEYGGEQLDDLAHKRSVPSGWRTRLRGSDHWVLMLRLLQNKTADDLLTRPLDAILSSTPAKTSASKENEAFKWSSQATLIELVQILLHARGAGTTRELEAPKLLVLLSCWDELNFTHDVRPRDALELHLPLFNSFLSANWTAPSCAVYGLSSLSKSLKHDKPDPEYQELGPEAFGYVVLPSGEQSPDLTLPVAILAEDAFGK